MTLYCNKVSQLRFIFVSYIYILHSIKHNFSGYPVAMHFNEQSHTMEDLRCIIIKNHVPNMDNRKLIEQKIIIKLNAHITGLNKDRDFLSHYDL